MSLQFQFQCCECKKLQDDEDENESQQETIHNKCIEMDRGDFVDVKRAEPLIIEEPFRRHRLQQKQSQLTKCQTLTDFSIDAIMGNTFGANVTAANISSVTHIGSCLTFQPHSFAGTDNLASSVTTNLSANQSELDSPSPTISNYNNSNNSNHKKVRPKKHKCPYCWVSLSNLGQLKGHVRIHTGERPFKCDHPYCHKTFTRNEELTRHKRIHTGYRPYTCQICYKCFGRKDHLKKHTRTHK